MLNSTTLEVAIGMAFVYLILSLFCTAINEAIAGILGSRAKNLEKGIKSLFTDGFKAPGLTLAQSIYDHGLVQSLYRSTETEQPWYSKVGSNLPSYIPARVFSSALCDVLFGGNGDTTAPAAVSSMLSKVQELPDSKGKQAILTLVSQAGGDITRTRQAFEAWYNDGMERVAGWYKRKTQIVLFVLGLGIAISLNVDSIMIGRNLWANPALRSYAVAAAEKYAAASADKDAKPSAEAQQALDVLQSLALPIGWSHVKGASSFWDVVFLITGWLLTAIAMTLGAPFWFDTLNRFMVIRSTIKPGEDK
jgi:hypothetical protein